VDDVLVWPCPWSGYRPPPVDAPGTARLVAELADRGFAAGVVLTSARQSPLPTALLLRLAGVPFLAAASEDYPGSLLDVRHHPPEGHEVERMVSVVQAAGFVPDPADDLRLAVRRPLPDLVPGIAGELAAGPYVVVHPGASVPARAPGPERAAAMVRALVADGWRVVVTGGPAETDLGRRVAGRDAVDLSGRTDLAELARVLCGARCVVVGNTGPAHLAAAVGTPVVSLFAPVVPAGRWAPWGVPSLLLGDQDAACRGTRARVCPVPGHPCLDGIGVGAVVRAVRELTDGEQDQERGARTRGRSEVRT
jgi:ADP-heptose:LPS heptosyltransferase